MRCVRGQGAVAHPRRRRHDGNHRAGVERGALSSTEDDRLSDPLSRAGNSPAGAGPTNSLTDVRGLRVGHATLDGDGWLTGVTVVRDAARRRDRRRRRARRRPRYPRDRSARPEEQRASSHAIVLGGGSAYRLVGRARRAHRLAALGRGVPVGDAPSHVVPIVPAAILFDLGRGGVFGNHPGAEAGDGGVRRGAGTRRARPVRGRQRGRRHRRGSRPAQGRPSASAVLNPRPHRVRSGHGQPVLTVTVAALAAVNSVGSVAATGPGVLYGAQFGLPGEFDWLSPPAPASWPAGVPAGRRGPSRPGASAPAEHDHRRDRLRREPDQGPVREARGGRARRARPRDQARALHVRRRHDLRPGDR